MRNLFLLFAWAAVVIFLSLLCSCTTPNCNIWDTTNNPCKVLITDEV